MKKNQTKAFANLIGSIVFIVFGVWALIQTFGFQTVANTYVQPAAFPQIMCIGMLVFAVILFVQSLIKLSRLTPDDPLAEQAPSINILGNRGVQAAVLVILLSIIYVALFNTLGYVAVSAIVSAIIMLIIGKRNPVQIALVSILVPLGMWLVFYKFLTVNIPMGVLQFLRDLVDMI